MPAYEIDFIIFSFLVVISRQSCKNNYDLWVGTFSNSLPPIVVSCVGTTLDVFNLCFLLVRMRLDFSFDD